MGIWEGCRETFSSSILEGEEGKGRQQLFASTSRLTGSDLARSSLLWLAWLTGKGSLF